VAVLIGRVLTEKDLQKGITFPFFEARLLFREGQVNWGYTSLDFFMKKCGGITALISWGVKSHHYDWEDPT
jgi:hypothetical protein